jgi:hypothetical protein
MPSNKAFILFLWTRIKERRIMIRTVYVLRKRDGEATKSLGFNYTHMGALKSLQRETRNAIDKLGGDSSKEILAYGEQPTEAGIYGIYTSPKSRNEIEVCDATSGYILPGFGRTWKQTFQLEKLEELVSSEPAKKFPARLAESLVVRSYAEEDDDRSLLVPPNPLGDNADIQEQLCNELQMVAYTRRMKLRSKSL